MGRRTAAVGRPSRPHPRPRRRHYDFAMDGMTNDPNPNAAIAAATHAAEPSTAGTEPTDSSTEHVEDRRHQRKPLAAQPGADRTTSHYHVTGTYRPIRRTRGTDTQARHAEQSNGQTEEKTGRTNASWPARPSSTPSSARPASLRRAPPGVDSGAVPTASQRSAHRTRPRLLLQREHPHRQEYRPSESVLVMTLSPHGSRMVRQSSTDLREWLRRTRSDRRPRITPAFFVRLPDPSATPSSVERRVLVDRHRCMGRMACAGLELRGGGTCSPANVSAV